MTQSYNLSQLANNLNTSGQLDATDGLVNAVPVANGGTGASTASGARTNLGLVIGTDIPSPSGVGASGTWNINISGNAATATTATTATTASNGGVTSVNGSTGSVTVATPTTTNVLNAIAAATVGQIGTYAMLVNISGSDILPGQTISGSSTYYSNAYGANFNSYTSPSGTWQCMGYARGSGNPDKVSLFLRIS